MRDLRIAATLEFFQQHFSSLLVREGVSCGARENSFYGEQPPPLFLPLSRKGTRSPMQDPFIGTWELDPTTLDYQFGRPGRRATYVIEAASGAGLSFSLDAEDADGKPLKFTYGGALDGQEQPLPGGEAWLVLRRTSQDIIESVLKRGSQVADRWTRELLPGLRMMRIIQYGVRPDGQEFQNKSIYRRVR
jgi:hypothetical protein